MYVFDHLGFVFGSLGMIMENKGTHLVDIVDFNVVPCRQLCRYIGYLLEGLRELCVKGIECFEGVTDGRNCCCKL
jgi:hypothetical protein